MMKLDKELSPHARAALAEVEKCTSCGLCKDVCPVFALSLREAESPRGKINLLRALMEEDLDPTSEGVDIFNRCLLCYACQDACPAGVKTERVWISAREILANEVGRPFSKSFFLRRVLPAPRVWNIALGLGRILPGGDDSFRIRGMQLPRPAGERINRLLPEVLEPRTQHTGSVAFFPGCLLSEVFPHIGLKAAEILANLGYRVITPADRVCCGAPAFNNGDLTTGRKLAERNLEIMTSLDVDAVISPDATCGGAFMHEWDLLFPAGSLWRKTYLDFREKVRDYGEFLLRLLSSRSVVETRPLEYQVTIHDSCHLSHLQHKADVPRKLLSFIPGIQIIESKQSDLCCGFGGSYSVLYPHDSRAIARRKLEYLRTDDEAMIVVGSPGCLWKLRSEAAELGLNVRVVHYLEVLWESLLGGGTPAPQAVDEDELKAD
ncbi:MAG TPA: (Fe-S)-binding protein [Bacteroidetes bacterium]|nr:(Fe-S)-binding protein [Bacteroidota bacterium]